MQTIDTIHSRRPSIHAFAPSYPVQTQAFPLSAAPISPLTPKTKTKKNRKPKKPFCSCPVCTTQRDANGVFYCIKDRDYSAYINGQSLGSRATQSDADTLLRDYHYTSLTKF